MTVYTGALAFDHYPVDLTVVHNDYKIKVPAGARFIQAWSDGSYEGISLKLISAQSQPIYFSRQIIIPTVADIGEIFLTNDVRAGRNNLVIYFVFTDTPLVLTQAGQDITQREAANRIVQQVHSYDRRGEVVFHDSFEDGDGKWSQLSLVGVSSFATSTDKSCRNKASMKITAGPIANNLIEIGHYLPTPQLTRWGYELHFNPSSMATAAFQMSLRYHNGVNYFWAYLMYDVVNSNLQIFTPAGWVNIATGFLLRVQNHLFHFFKLVIDFSTGRYVRAMVNGTIYDLSQNLLATGASADLASYIATMQLQSGIGTAANQLAYIDCATVTQNEP